MVCLKGNFNHLFLLFFMKTHYFSAICFVVVVKELRKNLKRFQIFFVKICRKLNKTFHFFCCFCSVGTLFFIIY